jgi:hypothetical protein
MLMDRCSRTWMDGPCMSMDGCGMGQLTRITNGHPAGGDEATAVVGGDPHTVRSLQQAECLVDAVAIWAPQIRAGLMMPADT